MLRKIRIYAKKILLALFGSIVLATMLVKVPVDAAFFLHHKSDTQPKIDIEVKEKAPHQEGIISEFYKRPNKSYFQEPKHLESLVNTNRLVQKILPKQADIDELLKIIQ